jgi:hypothetical protein
MASGAVRAAMPRTTGKIRLGGAAVGAMALLVFLAIGAFFGGWELMHPGADGSGLGMPAEWIKYSPFGSWFIPGLVLFTVFGVGSAVTVLAAILRHWSAPYLTFAIGVGQMIWITVELIVVQQFHPILAYLWYRHNEQAA